MKNIWIILVAAALVTACQTNTQKKATTPKEDVSEVVQVQKVELKVKGMTCTGCEKALENGLSKLDGVVKVEASHKKDRVVIKVEKDKYDKDLIKQKIETIGYSIEEQ